MSNYYAPRSRAFGPRKKGGHDFAPRNRRNHTGDGLNRMTRAEVANEWGSRCRVFKRGCWCCEAWVLFDRHITPKYTRIQARANAYQSALKGEWS